MYLFGDLEDAIRAKVLKFNIENDCKIIKIAKESGFSNVLKTKFSEYYNMDELQNKFREIKNNYPDDDVRQYSFWRNKAIAVILDDCATETMKRITKNNINCVADVFACPERLVDVSDNLKEAWRGSVGFYKKAINAHLYNDRIVLTNKFNSGQKIRKLFEIYNKSDDSYKLIPEDYKKMTQKHYSHFLNGFDLYQKDGTPVKAMKIVTMRNYIAGMSDAYANQMLQRYNG